MLILNTSKLVEIFVACDDFIINLEQAPNYAEDFGFLAPDTGLAKSEIMTICIYYHHSGLRCFKWFYESILHKNLLTYFPKAPQYEHFNHIMRKVLKELIAYLVLLGLSKPSKANYIDSKKLPVCHIKREKQNRVFKGIARKGKSSTGWFFGFKLHVLLNQWGELVNFRITTGNVADNNKKLLGQMFHNFQGWVFGDRGYWTKMLKELHDKGVELIPKPKKNQEGLPISPEQKHYAKKRGVIESVFDLFQNAMNIDHTRHRSPVNFVVNLVSALIGYTFLDKKPHTNLVDPKDYQKIVLC